jgi:hypothetical protein
MEFLRVLYDAIMTAHGEPWLRVLLLTGEGPNFWRQHGHAPGPARARAAQQVDLVREGGGAQSRLGEVAVPQQQGARAEGVLAVGLDHEVVFGQRPQDPVGDGGLQAGSGRRFSAPRGRERSARSGRGLPRRAGGIAGMSREPAPTCG